MVDRTSLARNRISASNHHVDRRETAAAILHGVHLAFHLRTLASELVEEPGVARLGVRHSQLDMVKAKQLRILHELNLGAPRILDESSFIESRDILYRLDDLGVDRRKFLHLR